jgi:hypothetical protein
MGTRKNIFGGNEYRMFGSGSMLASLLLIAFF